MHLMQCNHVVHMHTYANIFNRLLLFFLIISSLKGLIICGFLLIGCASMAKWVLVPKVVEIVAWNTMALSEGSMGYDVCIPNYIFPLTYLLFRFRSGCHRQYRCT